MNGLVKFLALVLFALVVGSCGGGDGENGVGTQSATPETREEVPVDVEEFEYSGGLEISLLDISNHPSSNPMAGTLIFPVELEVEIGNGSDKTIEFDQVRAIFYDEDRFVSGVVCSPSEDSIICWFWYEEDEPIELDEVVESVRLPPNRAAVFHLSSGGDFMIDKPTSQYISIAVISEGIALVENLYEY